MSSSTGITTNRYYYHTNHLGSIVALTNHSGNTVQTYSYDSFGKPYIVNGSGTLTGIDSTTNLYGNTRLYTGREYDMEVSLYFNRARYYNPDTGRFTSRDPIGQNDQINLYTCVANSPMNYVDRMGREKKFIAAHDATELFETDLHLIKNDRILSKIARTGFINQDYNPKMRHDYRELTFHPETKKSCAGENYSASCVVYVHGEQYRLDQLGNIMVGYGYTYSYMPFIAIYIAGLSVETIKNDYNVFKASENEKEDRPFYNKGIERAAEEILSPDNTYLFNSINLN